MTHYSDEVSSVRVDFFKSRGKWYTTEAMAWTVFETPPPGENKLLLDLFRDQLLAKLYDPKTKKVRLAGMWAVCLKPYHVHEHPLMMRVPGCDWCGLLDCEKNEEGHRKSNRP